MTPREWDATTYDELPLPHVEWGQGVIRRLNLGGHERVLDAGCGTGRDAAELLTQFPGVDLVGVDGSQERVNVARQRLSGRAQFIRADLTEPLDQILDIGRAGPVDAVMSVACFHWITDHARLFHNLAAIMRPGARLATDSGGQGNISNVERAIATVNRTEHVAKAFASPEETEQRLVAAGFTVESVRLRPHPIRIDNPDVLFTYLKTVCLGGYLERMEPDEGDRFTAAVQAAMPEPVLDYVRLEIAATRR